MQVTEAKPVVLEKRDKATESRTSGEGEEVDDKIKEVQQQSGVTSPESKTARKEASNNNGDNEEHDEIAAQLQKMEQGDQDEQAAAAGEGEGPAENGRNEEKEGGK